MKKGFLSLIALFAVATLSAQTAGEVVAKFNEGAELYNAKNYAAAAPLFEEVVSMGETMDEVAQQVAQARTLIPKAYFQLGMLAGRAKEFDKALEAFEMSAQKAQLFGDARAVASAKSMIANVYKSKGGTAFNDKDYATAAEIFANGYAANPNNTDLALLLAMSYCEMGKLDEGMAIYGNILGQTHSRFESAKATAKEKVDYYFMVNVAKLQEAKNYPAVVMLVEQWVAVDPTDAVAQKALVDAYAADSRFDKVIQVAETAASMQGEDAVSRSNIYYNLGAAYNAKEQKQKAIEALRKVTEGPNVASARQIIGELSK